MKLGQKKSICHDYPNTITSISGEPPAFTLNTCIVVDHQVVASGY
jgi:hypothetical protein